MAHFPSPGTTLPRYNHVEHHPMLYNPTKHMNNLTIDITIVHDTWLSMVKHGYTEEDIHSPEMTEKIKAAVKQE